jgi:hypothetical protein
VKANIKEMSEDVHTDTAVTNRIITKIYNNLVYLETALHVSGGTTTHYQERKQLYLQHLVFATHSTLKPVPTLLR